MAGTNRALAPGIDTLLVPTEPRLAHVSSTLVRQVASMGGDVSSLVPAPVAAAGPVAAAEPPERRVLWLVVNALVLAAAVASFLATDIFSKELVPGVLLPLLDVAFVIYFMFVFVIHRYRRRTDSSARAAELFRTGD